MPCTALLNCLEYPHNMQSKAGSQRAWLILCNFEVPPSVVLFEARVTFVPVGLYGSRSLAPSILKLGSILTCGQLHPWWISLNHSHWLAVWVSPRADLNVKEQYILLAKNRTSNPPVLYLVTIRTMIFWLPLFSDSLYVLSFVWDTDPHPHLRQGVQLQSCIVMCKTVEFWQNVLSCKLPKNSDL